MPAAVVAIGASVAGTAAAVATVGAITAASTFGTMLAYGAVSMATSMAVSSVLGGIIGSDEQDQQGQGSPAVQAARGMLLNTAGTVDPLSVLYGVRRIGGTLVMPPAVSAAVDNPGAQYLADNPDVAAAGLDPWQHYQDWGRSEGRIWPVSSQYLYIVLAHCEGEIDGFDAIYFDATVSTDARFAGAFTLEHFTGADAQAACANLMAALPAKWTAAHKLSGVAYTYIRLTFNTDVWRGVPVITADIRGRKVYDPRSATTAWSDNPALCLRDYLVNTRYGRGIAEAAIDDTTIIAAANYCDASITTPAGSQKRYTCNGLIDTNRNSIENVRALLTCMRGMLVFSGGKHKLVLDKADTAAFTFTEDTITGAWNIALGNKRGRFNRVRANWTNPANEWQPDIALAESAAYRVTDNALMLESRIDLPFTTDAYEAQMLAQRHLKQSRFGTIASFRATIAGLGCEVGDIVNITHSTPGWTGKPFRVVRIGLLSSDEVEVTAVEYDDSVYVAEPLTTPRVSVATNLPDPFTVAALTGLTLASGTAELFVGGDGTIVPRIKVTWAAATDSFVNPAGRIHAQFKRSTDSVWQDAAQVPGDAVQTHVAAVEDGVNYDVRIRAENSMGVRAATWTTVTGHTVIGKTAKPANVTGLLLNGKTLAWPAVADADLAGYRVRFQYGVNLEWGTANPVHAGLLTESPYVMQIVPPGQVSIMIRAVDTTGNESEASAYVITNFGDTPVANVVESYDFKAATWPGSITGATLSGDNLQADQPDIFYSADASDFYGIDGAPFYSTNYAGLEWISSGWTSSLAAAGSNMTLAWTLTGEAPTLQYRPTGPLPFYADDLSYFYGADADPFYDAPPDWSAWPGSLVADNQEYQWRVSTSSGATSGLLSAFTVSVDVPDKTLLLGGVAIGSGGTRLAGAIGEFNVIQNIQLTLQGGSTAMKVEASDYNNALGPLIDAKNSSGTGVAATIDAFLQGY